MKILISKISQIEKTPIAIENISQVMYSFELEADI